MSHDISPSRQGLRSVPRRQVSVVVDIVTTTVWIHPLLPSTQNNKSKLKNFLKNFDFLPNWKCWWLICSCTKENQIICILGMGHKSYAEHQHFLRMCAYVITMYSTWLLLRYLWRTRCSRLLLLLRVVGGCGLGRSQARRAGRRLGGGRSRRGG